MVNRQLSIVNRHFLEQRGQSDACISYAESRQNRTKSIVNGLSTFRHSTFGSRHW